MVRVKILFHCFCYITFITQNMSDLKTVDFNKEKSN